MADVKVRVEGDLDKVKIFSVGDAEVGHLIKDATDDIADKIEERAKFFAPVGKTGELKAHPTKRDKLTGVVEGRAPLFGGGFAIQGPLGFVKGVGETPGRTVSHIVISIPDHPKHAIWVHEGTGIFGPHHSPIVPRSSPFLVFKGNHGWIRTRSVRGQSPQPYLEKAYLEVDASYVPSRVERLRAEIDVLLG